MNKISAYTTIRCGNIMEMPFESAIKSALLFADEVVVVDSSEKDDGTMEKLEALMDLDERVQVYHADVDWKAPNSGIFDGQTKALARDYCSGDYLVQFDADEVFEDNFGAKLKELLPKVNNLTSHPNLLTTPVIEYWGSLEKVRIDTNSWKERVSRKDGNLTHGIPVSHRWYKNGLLYSKPGSDGCNVLDVNGNSVPCIHFINQESEKYRVAGIKDKVAAEQYQFWYQAAAEQLPTVLHFSWFSIARKIRNYREFWNDSWLSLYGEKQSKHAGWNPFFENKSLDEVSDEEIEAKAKELATETGGHVFHTAFIPGITQPTNAVKLNVELPECIKEWANKYVSK